MFKKKTQAPPAPPVPADTVAPSAEQPAKKFPTLPIGEGTAAGLIAVAFAAVGVLLCVKTCLAANPQEKKPKKEKAKKEKKSKRNKAEKTASTPKSPAKRK